jgi:hypothetical protein
VVADEAGDFGDYVPFHTADPRPVAGTQGLAPVGLDGLRLHRRLADRPHRRPDLIVERAHQPAGEAAELPPLGPPVAPADAAGPAAGPGRGGARAGLPAVNETAGLFAGVTVMLVGFLVML